MGRDGVSFPFPVHKYRDCNDLFHRLASGFDVTRDVFVNLKSRRVKGLSWLVRVNLMIWFVWYVFLYHKSYLHYGHFEGVTRLQLQHPVRASCNPLSPEGCPTQFADITQLPYCSQNPNASANHHKCKYYDAFDMIGGEIPGKTLFLPTRITTYEQKVSCTNPLAPCPETTKLVERETIYPADVENYTILIDHSFVSDELNVDMCAWGMLGFTNPCGHGWKLDERLFGAARDWFHGFIPKSMRTTRKPNCTAEEDEYEPILASGDLKAKHDTSETIRRKEKGIAMWLSPWWRTLGGVFLTPSFESVEEEVKRRQRKSMFTKLPNGDHIKLKDLLELADTNMEEHNNRYDGMVIILNIDYVNVKENSWPNRIPPAYFYSAYLAPANEYKAMQELHGYQRFTRGDGIREIENKHGVFVIVKQGGHIGAFSFAKLAMIVFIYMTIDSLYRSVFLCLVFNCGYDSGVSEKHVDTDGREISLSDKVVFEFKVYGRLGDDPISRDRELDLEAETDDES